MSTYTEWLDEFSHIEDHDKAATEALEDLGRLSQRARGLLHPLLTEALLMRRRTTTRTVERSISLGSVLSGGSSLEHRQSRLETTFALPDGRRVSWEQATTQDHLDRIAYLHKHIDGIERTIGSHEEAIALIRSHGVSCLGEIRGAA